MSRPSARPVSARVPGPRGGALIPAPKLSDYIFVEKLGSGTYATVYKAYRKVVIHFRDHFLFKCCLIFVFSTFDCSIFEKNIAQA